MEKEYIKLWCSYTAYFEPLGAAEVGRLVLAMLEYKSTGTAPKLDGNERFVWPAIRNDIDLANAQYQKSADANAENGKKGGRPKTHSVFEKPNKTQKTHSVFEKPNKSEKSQGKDKDKERNISSSTAFEPDFEIIRRDATEDDERSHVFQTFEQEICPITPYTGEEIGSYVDSFGSEMVIRAIEEASQNNKRSWAYVRAVLNAKEKSGIKTVAQWEAEAEGRKTKKTSRAKSFDDLIAELED